MKIVLSLMLLAATLTTQAQSPVPTETIRLDPSASFGGTTSGLFDEISFVPLETNKESLFSKIADLQVTDKYFIIYDHGGNTVMLFHKNGKFHCKIDLHAAKASVLDGFSVDRSRNEIIVRSHQKGNRLLIFDFNGKFLRAEKGDSIASYFTAMDSGYVAWQNAYSEHVSGATDYNLFIGQGYSGKIRQRELPFTMGLSGLDGFAFFTHPFTFSPQAHNFFYSKIHDYTLYQFGLNGLSHAYRFVFPAEVSLPQGFLTDSSMTGKRYKYINENPAKIYKIHNPFMLDGYLLFQLETMGPRDRDRVILYSKASGRSYSFGKIAPDSTCSSMPVINRGIDLLATDETYLYTCVTAPVLVRMYESRTEKTPVSETLKSFFARDARMDNPVLIRLKLKPGL